MNQSKSVCEGILLPAASILAFSSEAAALWDQDHRRCDLNPAAVKLLGLHDSQRSADPAFWVSRIEPRDRQRWTEFCAQLQSESEPCACSYRFAPGAGSPVIQLQEVAQRIQPASGPPVIFSRYWSSPAGECRSISHKIRNHLQAVRGEIDLLRLSDSLPERSAAAICRAIDAIHELVHEIGNPRHDL